MVEFKMLEATKTIAKTGLVLHQTKSWRIMQLTVSEMGQSKTKQKLLK